MINTRKRAYYATVAYKATMHNILYPAFNLVFWLQETWWSAVEYKIPQACKGHTIMGIPFHIW